MKGRKASMPKPKAMKMAKAKAVKPTIPYADPMPIAEEMPPVMGGKARMRLDRPGRKLGGRVGADSAPLSTAAKRC